MAQFLLCFCFVIYALNAITPSLQLNINEKANGKGFYSININNKLWLESGQLEGYFNNQWYTSNTTTSQTSNTFKEIKLISSSMINNRYDDFGGEYDEMIYEWQTADTNSLIFNTNFKIYKDGQAISFVQSFPNGADGTNYITTQLSGNCDGGTMLATPFLSFPSFNEMNQSSMYASSDLGYLTWRNTFSTAGWGKTPVTIGDLAGFNGGPIVLYDSDDNAMVLSTIDNFASSTQVNNGEGMNGVATFMYDADRNDSLFCITSQCYSANTFYESREVEGTAYIVKENNNELVALNLWYSDVHQDNYVATTSSPPDGTYTITFNNGYIYSANDAADRRLAVDLYYNSDKQDWATAATSDIKKQLLSGGYVFNSTQGYIENATVIDPGSMDLKMGLTSQLMSVPEGFIHETVIVVGDGINNAMMHEFGKRIQSKYHTSRLSGDKDVVTSHLGYWTDDGAYYYGDSWNAVGPDQNLTCCSLDRLKQVKVELDKSNIPIQYWQMDDWWYIGPHPDSYWGGVKAVSHWEPPAQYYPGGLAALSKDIQVPLLLYGPYFAVENDWSGQFDFVPEGAGYVLPSPDDSYSFYSTLFDFGINASTNGPNTGMIGYEVDFMSCLGGTPIFRTRLGTEQQWLNGMNKAAQERGLPIQYCMAAPFELMESLSLPQVTNGRASGDYADGNNWDIGPGAMLWHTLGLKPSKDNFWTYFNEPIEDGNHPFGSDHNSCEVHAMVALFSTGPVGISDRAGYSNATLIKRLCDENGRLLQTSRPITAIDDQFIMDVFNGESINVWSSEFGPYDGNGNVLEIYQVVLALNMETTYSLNYNSFPRSLNPNFMYIVRNWHAYDNCMTNGSLAIASGCVMAVAPNSKELYSLKPQQKIAPMQESFELVHVIEEVSYSSCVLLGELDKYVSVSQHRFANLIISGSSLSVDIRGKIGEKVTIYVLMPNSASQNDWKVLSFDVVIPNSGVIQFNTQ